MTQPRGRDGRFVKSDDVSTGYYQEDGKNQGNQNWIGGRFHSDGVELNMASLEYILADPHILKMVQATTADMLQEAQEIAVLDEAQYGMIVYNNRPELGPVGVVFCDNYPSVIDDAMNQTLYKVLAKFHNQ